MANGANVRNIEKLCKNADIESMVNYFLNGTILKWCKSYGYNDLVGELLELNDTLISKLYEIFGIEINPEELEDFLRKYDELFNNYSNLVEYKML